MTSFHGFYNMETGNNIERTDSITARSFCLQENNRRRKVRTCLFLLPAAPIYGLGLAIAVN
jgi:hypothetical protein